MALTTVDTQLLSAGLANSNETVSPIFDAAILHSPTLTGTPTAITAAAGNNTTQIATNAFVYYAIRHVDSPTFTGTPAAPTAAAGTNNTQVATTAYVDSATSTLATTLLTVGANLAAGTRMVFQQNTAPTGWTRDDSWTGMNDSALRVVSGVGVVVTSNSPSTTSASGGSSKLSTLTFPGLTISGTTDGHTLTIAEMPSHTHSYNMKYITGGYAGGGDIQNLGVTSFTTGSAGGNGSHSHTFSTTTSSSSIGIKYTDVIICKKTATS
jgi:hypothetical protein